MDDSGGFSSHRKPHSGGENPANKERNEQQKAPKQKRKRQGPLELIGQTDAQAKRNRRVKVSLASPYQNQSFGCISSAIEENVPLKNFLVCGVNDVTAALESHQRRLFLSFFPSSPSSSSSSVSSSSSRDSKTSSSSFSFVPPVSSSSASRLSSCVSADTNSSASSSASTPSTTLSSPASSASSSASSVSPSSPSSLSSPHSAAASSLSLNADVVRDKEAPHAGQAERGPPRSEGETSEPAATGLAGEGSEPDSNGAEDGRDQATDGTDTSSPAGEPPVEHGENKHGENKKQAEKENVAMGGESETEVASAGSVRSKDEEHTRTREAGLRRKPHVSRVEQAVPKCQTHAEHAQEEVVGAVGIVQTGLGARIVQHLPLMAALLGLPCLIFKRESTALCDILGLPSVAAFAVRAPRDSRRSQLSLSSPSCSSSSALPADSPAMAACPSPRPDACAAPSLKASLAAFLSLSASLVYPTSFPFFLPRLHPPGVPAAAPRLPRGRGARRPEGPSDECVFSPASSGLDGAETKTEETRHAVETLGTRNDVDEDGKGEEDGRQDGREDLGKGLPAAGTFRSGPGVSAACARRLRIETRGWQPFLGTCLATSFCDARDAEAGNKKTRRETRRLKRRERRRLLFKKAKARKEEKKPKAGQEKE